jgi:signal transduction histidine kinase
VAQLRSPSLNSRLFVAMLAALLVLSLVWALSHRRATRLARTSGEVEHSYVVLLALERTHAEVSAAERSARGYLLTGARDHAQAFDSARATAAVRLDSLDRLTADHPEQRQRVRGFSALVGRRLAALERAIRVRRDSGASLAAATAERTAGDVTSDSIRRAVDEMERIEERHLSGRTLDEAAGAERMARVVTLGFLAALAISVLAAAVLRRNFEERARGARALQEAKDQAEEARARAEQASRAKSDFLARMSHELRTPLNSIIGFSNVLLKNRAGSLRQQEVVYLQRILANGKQLLALINDILDLSKVEAGRVQLQREPVALDSLVDDLIAGFEGQLQEREGVELVADMPSEVAPITTDAAKLQQVVLNLIGNALKFTEQGTVTVRVVVAPTTRRPVRLEVADTGVGIAPERREAIFEAFEQADVGVARRYGGTGLGLAIARSLCTAMGYGLEVRANPEGGSVFSVLFTPDGVTDDLVISGARRASQTPVSLYRVGG